MPPPSTPVIDLTNVPDEAPTPTDLEIQMLEEQLAVMMQGLAQLRLHQVHEHMMRHESRNASKKG